jgi:hypothetical protein
MMASNGGRVGSPHDSGTQEMKGGCPSLGPIFLCPKISLTMFLSAGVCDSDTARGYMKDRTHFAHRLDVYGSGDEVVEHLAGIEDYLLAVATYHAACRRWPDAHLKLRQADRVIADSRQDRARL